MENKKALVTMRGYGSQTEYVLGEFVRHTKTQFTLLVEGQERRFKFHNPELFVKELSGDGIGMGTGVYRNYISASEYVPSEHDHLLDRTRIKKMIERVQFVVRTDQRITTEQWEAMDKILKGEQHA